MNLRVERSKLHRETGLDFLARPSDEWLELAVGAERLGLQVTQKDYERAMELRAAYDKQRARR